MTARTRTQALARVLAPAAVLSLVIAAAGTTSASAEATSSKPTASSLQQQVLSTHAAYLAARQRVEGLSEQESRLAATAVLAEQTATRLHDQVSGQGTGFFAAVKDAITPGESALDQAADAADNAEHARELADMVQSALDRAISDAEHSRTAWEKAQQRQLKVEAKWSAQQYADAMIARSQLPKGYAVSNPQQDARNLAALRAWQTYLNRLGKLGVVPPPAKQIDDPNDLAQPLRQVRDKLNRAVPGVAEVDPTGKPAVTVLPAEAVRAVSEAFHRLGLPTAPDDMDASTYACGGLLANAWGTSATLPGDVTGQWQQLTPASRDQLQVGDVVVLGSKKGGLDQSAVYVGQQRVIVADATTGTAGVQPLPGHYLGVRRATLPQPAGTPATKAAPAGGTCGVAEPTVTKGPTGTTTTGSGPLQVPLAPGTWTLSAGFGDGGALWSSGEHTGQDLAAPIGTPVSAAGAGTVTIEHPSWAGNLVRIDHGGGVETWYAHLSKVDVTDGQTVQAGDLVGEVGDLGNTTGPHLHLEVRLDGSPVDPTRVIDLGVPQPTYANGQIPTTDLCPATSDGSQLLRCDAAVAFRMMGAAYEADNGAPLCITDSYRSLAGQERAHVVKPTLTAKPGTSQHGFGVAVDLCGGIERFDTPQHDWVVTHGPAYGWHHPSWAEPGGSKPEPWHFEYGA